MLFFGNLKNEMFSCKPYLYILANKKIKKVLHFSRFDHLFGTNM